MSDLEEFWKRSDTPEKWWRHWNEKLGKLFSKCLSDADKVFEEDSYELFVKMEDVLEELYRRSRGS